MERKIWIITILIGIAILGTFLYLYNPQPTKTFSSLLTEIFNVSSKFTIPITKQVYTGEYSVFSKSGNESLFDVNITKLKSGNSQICLEAGWDNYELDSKTKVNYNVPSILSLYKTEELIKEKDIVKTKTSELTATSPTNPNKFCYEANPKEDFYLKFGDESIIVIQNGQVAGGSLVNVTAEVNFTHLNISTTAPYDSLILYYPFDGDKENTKLTKYYDWSKTGTDEMGVGPDGVGYGNVTVNNTNCIYGDCASFDGNGDYVQTNLNINTTKNINISLCGWINFPEYPGGANIKIIFIDTSTTIRLMLYGTKYLIFDAYNSSGDRGTYPTYSTQINNSGWHHVCGGRNDTSKYISVDGSIVNTVSYTGGGANYYTSASLAISSTTTGAFNGTMDEVMVFDTSLTSAQILAIYKNQSSRFAVQGTQSLIVDGCVGNLSGYTCSSISGEIACGEQPECLWLTDSCIILTGVPYCSYFLSNATCEGEYQGDACQWRFGVDTAENRVNVTTYIESLLGSSINLSVGYRNLTGWFYTAPQVVSSGAVKIFNISSTSNGLAKLSLNYTHIAGNSTNPFYSPIIQYNITLTTWNVDITPPTFDNLRNFTHTVNTSFSQSITASDANGISSYWLNDTTYFSVDGSGLITNVTNLSRIEIYWLNISANDTLNNINSGIFYIDIIVATPTITAVQICRYKKLGYWNPRLVWLRQTGCI